MDQNQSYKETLDFEEKQSTSEPDDFYIKKDLNGANWVNIQENWIGIQENTNKLGLMDEILGENITLKDGESRSNKLYRLAYVFSELLDIVAEKNVEVQLKQVSERELSQIRKKEGENCIYVKSEGEFYVWKLIGNQSDIDRKVSKGRQSKKLKEKKKKFLEFQNENPVQMSLFRLLEKEKDYSHTIELYDFIPKYVWGKSKRIEGKFLEPISREFVCKGTAYKVVLLPARIQTETGDYIDYFPGKREELVEDALRKIMSDIQGVFLDDSAGTTFTLYQLQSELKNREHSYSYDQLKESLEILAKTDIELESEDDETKIIFRAIETLGLSGKDGETQTFVRFSPLVTQSIKKGTFRLINYEKVMSYKTTVARQLHKRMSHFYTQASLTEKYNILLSTIIRDFGLTRYSQLRNNLADVEKGIDELKEKNIIINCAIDKIFDVNPKTKLNDVKFTFQPHPYFVDEIKKANYKINTIKERLINSGVDYE
ncbi:MAG: RepB family plasmid replication initiator protein [Acidobacteriota bacterium]|nr:RepB family plasmid replication initiator protein [Acidobacteriota bacterium]